MALVQRTLALLINFADKGKNPSVSTALTVLNILQNHYPERLGLACVINVPFIVNAFFKIVMPFVDPITRPKVKFNPKIFQDGLFTEDMVTKEWGGSRDFEYVHEKYWPELVEMCEKRVKTWKESWKILGAKVGISEWDYKTATSSAISTEKVQGEGLSGSSPADASPNTQTQQPANAEAEKLEQPKDEKGAAPVPETAPSGSHEADHSISVTTAGGAVSGSEADGSAIADSGAAATVGE